MNTKKCNKCGKKLPFESFAQNRHTCKECRKAYHRAHYKIAYPKYGRQKKREDYLANIEYYKAKGKERNLKIKTEVFTHYSPNGVKCAHCGYNDIRALSLDHINGNGADYRRQTKTKGGSQYYYKLKREGYIDGLQVLCMNCQFIKRFTNGESN
jgi:hypothetical protein